MRKICSKIFARGYIQFELHQKAYDILNYHVTNEAKKKNKYNHFSIRRKELRIYDHDASKQLLTYVHYIQQNGYLKDVNLLMFQEQYGQDILLRVVYDQKRYNDYTMKYYKKVSTVWVEPLDYLREKMRTNELIAVHGYADENLLRKLEKGDLDALEEVIQKKEWVSFYFQHIPDMPSEEKRTFSETYIEEVKITANRQNLEFCLISGYVHSSTLITSFKDETISERVDKNEKRKMKIGHHVLPLYAPLLKTHLKETEKKYRFVDEVVQNDAKEWVNPCTMCMKRLENVTNRGCVECAPCWMK